MYKKTQPCWFYVCRSCIQIQLGTYAALNWVNVCAGDIKNAYLQAPLSCKDYIICAPKFGLKIAGKVALIHHALYGRKSAGGNFGNHLQSCVRHLDFVSCLANPEVWIHRATHSNGMEIYKYLVLYTDEVLWVSENAEKVLWEHHLANLSH